MTNDPRTDGDPLERLVEEFAARCRSGEPASISEYAAEHPEYAGQIAELFPAVAMMEELRAAERARHTAAATRAAVAAPPERLGDFRVIREIGRGGMGVVYEAEQVSLARGVAVKVLPEHAFSEGRRLERFRREAQTAARLHHTNIVPVFGVGEQEGLNYYVMPLVRGVGLDEIIRELAHSDGIAGGRDIGRIVRELTARKFAASPAGPQAEQKEVPASDRWRAAAQIGFRVAEALDYAHGQGTLHRDIKPGNILVDADGGVYVADFGLATALDETSGGQNREVAGTARYMAPEQMRGTPDARSDIYALGLTLCELLTPGERCQAPFAGTAQRVLRTNGAWHLSPPAIPRDLEAVVRKCMADDPARRYQSAAAVAADLRRFLEDRPVRARRASAVERAWRWRRRNPALALMSSLSAVLLLAVALTAVVGYVRTRTAYADTRRALQRAEATSQLSLEALENIYRQLSPERLWIAADADPGGQACACVGLGSGGEPSVDPGAAQVQASRETAAVLASLLVFYDRLAEQGGPDRRVLLQAAIACRRVGDIRLCLGQMELAENAYSSAVEKLTALRLRPDADMETGVELVRSLNEIGNVQWARLDFQRAYASHQRAFGVLESVAPSGDPPEEYRYELARTMYFLASQNAAASDDRRAPETKPWSGGAPASQAQGDQYRKSAIGILDELVRENPRAPDYRLLLALCCRPAPAAASAVWGAAGARDRQRAVRLLEGLVADYPGVADYRYELIAAYAWTPVSLFPWQGRAPVSAEGEESLRKALPHAQWLVEHHPGAAHYARCQAIILAKLATACWRAWRLSEADDLLSRALGAQTSVVAKFPDLPAHNRVLVEFFRLRFAQVRFERNSDSRGPSAPVETHALLDECIENLTELRRRPDLAGDRLAGSSLALAYDALSELLARNGDKEGAEQAAKKAKAIRAAGPPSAVAEAGDARE